jgi:hypothetical protein
MTWAPPREYRTNVAVEQINPGHHVVTSKPPLYTATVIQQGSGTWKVHVVNEPATRDVHDASLTKALVRAGELVGRLAGRAMMRFSAQQRMAMGRQKCPKRLGPRVCCEPATVGTVWCEWHPRGEEATDG